MKLALSLAAVAALWTSAALAEPPRVVATIKPVHALVSAVMGDLGTPELIVRGGASPHTYSLRPSDAGALENADLVFWTGHGMELFLEEALESLTVDATVVELAASPGIELLPVRAGGAFEAHGHAGEGHDGGRDDDHGDDHGHDEEHGQGPVADMHFWLDPLNAVRMVEAIAGALAAADPANAADYQANAARETERLEALAAEIDLQLTPLRDRPFVVFHDAYQYFEQRFGLIVAGTVTVTPDTMPGAARIAEIRGKIGQSGAACVFAEPQFEPAIVETIVEGTGARIGTLDPEGSALPEGPELYLTLLRGLAASIADCLTAAAP